MQFMAFLAAIGLATASALLGAQLGAAFESSDDGPPSRRTTARRGWTTIRLLIVIVGCVLILLDPAVLSPWWVQYLALAVVPFLIGMLARITIARRLSPDQNA